jgi:predicted amidophosphoribosyltransferase
MKFCPQCGTFFEPEAHFCLECGFDRSTVESISPAPLISPDVLNSDTEINTAESAEVIKTQSEITLACPQCGKALIPGDRFCLECGFDTSGKKDVPEDVPQAMQPHIVEDETFAVTPVVETVSVPGEKQFCPQCGSGIDDTERFCQECGFDTSGSKEVIEEVPQAIQPPLIEEETIATPVVETVSVPGEKQFCPQCGSGIDDNERFCQECGFDTKTDEIVTDIKPEPAIIPAVADKQSIAKPAIPQPPPEPVPQTSPINYQTSQKGKPATQQREKKTWQRIAIIIIGAGILGAAGWFGYNKFIAASKETPDNASVNTKPMSLMDQELAKQKEKVQNLDAQQNTTNEDAVESAKVEENKIPSKVILEVGHKEEPKNKNPANPAKLTISVPTMITRITTDHYNDGMGTPRGGIITIKDRSGMVVAGYKALGKTGKNGTPSAKWVAEPDKILKKGTYFIWDSDPKTWSKTFIGNNGFVVVEGYEVE